MSDVIVSGGLEVIVDLPDLTPVFIAPVVGPSGPAGAASTVPGPAGPAGPAGPTGPSGTTDYQALSNKPARGLPSYVPAAVLGVHDQTLRHYNVKETNTRRLRAALSKAANGGLGEIIVDSDSGGAGATNGSIPTYDRLAAWPMAMRDEFASQGVPIAGTGLVRAQDASSVDARWTFTGTWVNATTYRYSATAGSSATFTTDKAGSTAAVKYTDVQDGSVFTISVNGATSGNGFSTVTANGPVSLKTALVNTLAMAAGATVKITLVSGAIYLLGANVYTPNAGLLVHNVSQSGSTAYGAGNNSWSDTGAGNLGALFIGSVVTVSGGDPDAVFIALGGNDKQGAATDAQVTAAIASIRALYPTSDVVLVAQQQLNDTLVPALRWETYVASLYTLADTLDVPLIDFRARVGNYAQTVAAGLTTDGQGHFLAPGNIDNGRNAGSIVKARYATALFPSPLLLTGGTMADGSIIGNTSGGALGLRVGISGGRLGFFGATATLQPGANVSLADAMSATGMRQAGTVHSTRSGYAGRTSSFTVTANSSPEINMCNATAGGFIGTVANTNVPGVEFTFTKFDATTNVVQVVSESGGTINGTTAPVILDAPGDSVTIVTSTTSGAIYIKHDNRNVKVRTYLADATWTKPAGLKYVEVYAQAAGGGGASGRRNAAGTPRYGGGGGGGGGLVYALIPASVLTNSTEGISVSAAGGVGGAAVSADNFDGNPGVAGGNVRFGLVGRGGVWARGGVGGSGGSATSGTPGGGGVGNTGGASSISSAAGGGNAQQSLIGAPGGGAGGGVSATDVAYAGGTGGFSYALNGTSSSVPVGTAPVAATAGVVTPGQGGPGSNASTTAAPLPGTDGANYGAGGGGGGASVNGFASGAGGAGGAGILVVIEHF